MRVVVTNDDGIDSRGLLTLAQAVVDAGMDDVVVVAPAGERSGTSAALVAELEGRHVRFERRQLSGLPDKEAYAVAATPAYIAKVVAHGAFGVVPDLVVSGINHGPNTGHAVVHSGTVGAALTASVRGIPAVAFSSTGDDPRHLPTAAGVVRTIVGWVLEDVQRVGGATLNVNIPDVPGDHLRGIRPADLAAVGEVVGAVGERGSDFVTVTFEERTTDPEAGTDVALLAEGWATVTMVRPPMRATDVNPFPEMPGGRPA